MCLVTCLAYRTWSVMCMRMWESANQYLTDQVTSLYCIVNPPPAALAGRTHQEDRGTGLSVYVLRPQQFPPSAPPFPFGREGPMCPAGSLNYFLGNPSCPLSRSESVREGNGVGHQMALQSFPLLKFYDSCHSFIIHH